MKKIIIPVGEGMSFPCATTVYREH